MSLLSILLSSFPLTSGALWFTLAAGLAAAALAVWPRARRLPFPALAPVGAPGALFRLDGEERGPAPRPASAPSAAPARLTPALLETLQAARALGQGFTTDQLAARLGLTRGTASQRLTALSARGDVRPRRDPRGSWEIVSRTAPTAPPSGHPLAQGHYPSAEAAGADLLALMRADAAAGDGDAWWGSLMLARWEARGGMGRGAGAEHAAALEASGQLEPAGRGQDRRWRAR